MAARAQAGFTLIELIMFIVIVSVGLAGVLIAFNVTTAKSADPLITKQLLRVAEGMMQEVLEKSYQNVLATATAPGDPNNSGPDGCTPATTPSCNLNNALDRANYNDVDDYIGFGLHRIGITRLDGGIVYGLENYSVDIEVDKTVTATLGGLSAASNQVKIITVTVSAGNQSITLVGYRTNYGY